jgi:hypothetical protein
MFWKHHQISRNNYVSYGFFLLVFSCSDVLIRFFRNIQISTYKKKNPGPKTENYGNSTEILQDDFPTDFHRTRFYGSSPAPPVPQTPGRRRRRWHGPHRRSRPAGIDANDDWLVV